MNATVIGISLGPLANKEMLLTYIRNTMQFFGVTNIENVVVEGHNLYPDRARFLIAAGVEVAQKTAARF